MRGANMRARITWVSIFIAFTAYCLLVDDPLNSTVGFFLAGIVPGTDITLGLWPTLALSLVGVLLAKRLTSHIQLRMLSSTATSIKKEKLKADFIEKNSSETVKKNPAVIAAPTIQS